MKNSMVKTIKKVTATILAAATVMGATIAVAPTMVKADDFNGINLEELPEHPTAGMDLNVIKNAYNVGNNLGTNIPSGTVAYINSYAVTGIDGGTPHGTDIVVVYRTYEAPGWFGQKFNMVNCKSLIDGETFELHIGESDAQLYEINKAQNLNNAGIRVDDDGLQTSFQQVKGWVTGIKDWLFG